MSTAAVRFSFFLNGTKTYKTIRSCEADGKTVALNEYLKNCQKNSL